MKRIQCLRKVFLEASWWKRLWCVQKFVHARSKSIVSGSRSIPWTCLPLLRRIRNLATASEVELFESIFSRADYLPRLQKKKQSSMCAADSIVVYSQFVSSLNFLGDRGCSDPRDKIYSLVSLSKPVQSKLTLD